MVLISQEEWQSLYDKLDRLAEMIENRNATDLDAEWLVIALHFRSIAEKDFYVNRADLDAYLRRHRIDKVK